MFGTGNHKKMGALAATTDQKDLACMKELLEAGKVVPVIDRRYSLGEVPKLSSTMEKDTPKEE